MNNNENKNFKKENIVKNRKSKIRAMSYIILSCYTAAILIIISRSEFGFKYFLTILSENIVIILSIILVLFTIYKNIDYVLPFAKKERKFQDVDDYYKYSQINIDSLKEYIKTSIEESVNQKNEDRNMNEDITSDSLKEYKEETIKETVSQQNKNIIEDTTFISYFSNIKTTLEHKSQIADEKASILLDKGTKYAKFGLVFYIISIIIWQVLVIILGQFQTQMIYGIVSCSFLFIFVEFLSAWFLKQYRNFIDTSTYLIKVKSIFDKYMLIVLYAKEAGTEIEHKDILNYLAEEIQWPDINKFSRREMSFAKEALESASIIIKSLKKDEKGSSNE